MIGYRFLPPSEEEMIAASEFYESRSAGLGLEFLEDIERVIELLREYPKLGYSVGWGLATGAAAQVSVLSDLFRRAG
jgi:hypothetical protein